MATKQGFTEPQLNEYGADLSREWYVGFRHTCPSCQVRKAYQLRMGINYLKTVAERRAEGKAVESLLKKQLQAGWNPHHEKIEDFLKRQLAENPALALASNALSQMPFNDALTWILEEKQDAVAKSSYRNFRTSRDYAHRAARKLGISTMPIENTKRRHIKALLAQMVRDRQEDYDAEGKGKKVTGNFYNKHRSYLSLLFTELEDYEAVEYNPCAKIKNRVAITTNQHRHATDQEREQIKERLKYHNQPLLDYLEMEHATGIRPKEIFSIRIADVDMKEGFITLNPIDGGSKTRQTRRVPIPDSLMPMLRRRHLERYAPDWYLFSDHFVPGPRRKPGFYASKQWELFVKKPLGIDVTLYSFKGLGGDDKRKAGVDLLAVSSQYGHNKLSTTLLYIPGEKERMEEELRRKTPGL